MSQNTSIIIDVGSYNTRAGPSSETEPRVTIRSLVAHLKVPNVEPKTYFGQEAWQKRGAAKLRRPIEEGKVVNWSDAEELFRHIYTDQLQVDPAHYPVVFAVSPAVIVNQGPGLYNTFFKNLGVLALYATDTASLALKAAGISTGVVLHVGYESTTSVAVSKGELLPETLQSTNFAGSALTDFFVNKVNTRGEVLWSTGAELTNAAKIKDQVCYVPMNARAEAERFEKEGVKTASKDHEGNEVYIREEQFQVGEALFTPSDAGSDASGLDRLVFNTISAAPKDIQAELYKNIVLAGGTTLIQGLGARLKTSVEALAAPGTVVEIVEPKNREIAAWVGASKLVSESSFNGWVRKDSVEF